MMKARDICDEPTGRRSGSVMVVAKRLKTVPPKAKNELWREIKGRGSDAM